jgi:hypothetical protein
MGANNMKKKKIKQFLENIDNNLNFIVKDIEGIQEDLDELKMEKLEKVGAFEKEVKVAVPSPPSKSKYVKFSEAIDAMVLENRKIRNVQWSHECYLYWEGGVYDEEHNGYHLQDRDLVETWGILD